MCYPERGIFCAMFTGIITNTGICVQNNHKNISIKTEEKIISRLKTGSSVAVSGVCLTVTKIIGKTKFAADVMPETLAKTTLKTTKPQTLVNLELPATPTSFLAGHIVQGHIDEVGKLEKIGKSDNSQIVQISIPQNLAKYIVEKGSIAINGISLTIIKKGKNYFTVGIIPHTLINTNFHTLKTGDPVNIEVDVLAKYVENLLKKGK